MKRILLLALLISSVSFSSFSQSTITYDDKDRTLPTSHPRRNFTQEDANEIKSVVNTNATLMALKTSFVDGETPAGLVNSSNLIYTLAHTPIAGSVKLYQNGLRLKVNVDFTISGPNITFIIAPITGDDLTTDYRK